MWLSIKVDLHLALVVFSLPVVELKHSHYFAPIAIKNRSWEKLGIPLSHIFYPDTQIIRIQTDTNYQFNTSANLHPNSVSFYLTPTVRYENTKQTLLACYLYQ